VGGLEASGVVNGQGRERSEHGDAEHEQTEGRTRREQHENRDPRRKPIRVMPNLSKPEKQAARTAQSARSSDLGEVVG
jgi:hypothetical protein